jgi:nucleoside-diphosphate-sugar epimerase
VLHEAKEIMMRVFVTGATGFIGSAIVQELINAGHQVPGLARSDAGAKSLIDAGAQVHRGNLEDLESLRSGATASEGVIHTAFNHDFSKFAANCEMDRRAIEALGSALAGSDRPLIVTSGTGLVAPGRLATEEDVPASRPTSYPRVSEETAALVAARGVRTCVVRLPQVHDRVKQGLVTYMIAIAREKGARRLSPKGSTAGPRCIGSMLRISTGSRLRRDPREPGITRSPKRACRCGRSLTQSAGV